MYKQPPHKHVTFNCERVYNLLSIHPKTKQEYANYHLFLEQGIKKLSTAIKKKN